MRLDHELARDIRRASRSRAIQMYLVIELVAAAVFVAQRGSDTASMVALIWLGLSVVAFLAWWAGRHHSARPDPAPVPAAQPRSVFAMLASAGLLMWALGLSVEVGFVLTLLGVGGWAWAWVRAGGPTGLRERMVLDPRPFLALYLFIALPRLLAIGPLYVLGALVALPSGIGQQLLLLLGLFAPLEAATRRPGWSALLAASVFALLHIPNVMAANHDDHVAAIANVALFQLSVGMIAVLAYRRHRAAVPIGVAHGLTIG